MGIGGLQNEYGILVRTVAHNSPEKCVPSGLEKTENTETMDYMAFLQEKCEEILEKLRNGETEVSYPIGGQSFTEREWDKLLKKFDDVQEDARRKMEERIRKLEEKEAEKRIAEG